MASPGKGELSTNFRLDYPTSFSGRNSYIGGVDDLIGLLECMDEDCSWECD